MPRKLETQQGKYTNCEGEGSFLPVAEPDLHQIEAMLTLAESDLQAAKDWIKQAPKDGPHWNAIFRLHYDILHLLLEAFVLFDALKAKTHECLFAYVCEKHRELEFSWDFLEGIRRKRNRSVYYGEPATYQQWKEIELQLNLYISMLKRVITEKLKIGKI